MDKAVVAIVGAGKIGQIHIDNILGMNNVELKAILDVYTDHLQGTAYEKAVPIITNNPEDITNDPEIDGVLICTSTDTHAAFIELFANAGKHIFCEKPISFKTEETKRALDAVDKAGVKFQIGFNRRFDRHFRKVQETVREGEIGNPHIIKITSRDPQPPPEEYVKRSGGMFMDMTIHDFDMIRYLSGSEVKEISVKSANLIDDRFERNNDVDTAIITLTFEDGSLGVIDNSRQAVYGYDQRIEVFGSKGSAEAENERPTNVKISTKEAITVDHPKYFFLERYNDAYIEEIKQFAIAIMKNSPVACSGEDGLKAELLARAAQLSLEENRSVPLTELTAKA
ncbi:inositol 2-dehydrogenase [Alteribacillus sp. YIM 98480]|uniref:inositol 2-dehydrogenase n=1 Tax=Alteribacillus sp. YIM 98480 TaxID=2606599 RepID=UPI00131AB6BB|nr:inositol 2-dehydrogenase [Alteribacillus sp. YIM 98480]